MDDIRCVIASMFFFALFFLYTTFRFSQGYTLYLVFIANPLMEVHDKLGKSCYLVRVLSCPGAFFGCGISASLRTRSLSSQSVYKVGGACCLGNET